MDLFSTILGRAVENDKLDISYRDVKITADELVKCCAAVSRIKEIIENASKVSPEYFYQIEQIVRVLGDLGIG